jgi:heterodisulfide reductase subunit B
MSTEEPTGPDKRVEYLYYPGCTLAEKARSYDVSGRAAAHALDVELKEMPAWTCCGTTVPLTNRKIVGMLAPIRTLFKARQAGHDELLTLCTFCYNVLKRASFAYMNNDLDRRRILTYLKDEAEREGEELPDLGEDGVKVVHLLEVLRDQIGFDTLAARTRRPLAGLRVAPYYGCLLLRPKAEMQLDDDEEPTILEAMLTAIGCEVIDFPHKVECCGSYLGLSAPATALESSYEIIHMASRLNADVIALVCPLCSYNLDRRQEEMSDRFMGFSHIPVLYFTQLLALAMDLGEQPCLFDEHAINPLPILQERQIL